MKSYPYSAARGSFATVLVEAERDGAVEIRRRYFESCPHQHPREDPRHRR